MFTLFKSILQNSTAFVHKISRKMRLKIHRFHLGLLMGFKCVIEQVSWKHHQGDYEAAVCSMWAETSASIHSVLGERLLVSITDLCDPSNLWTTAVWLEWAVNEDMSVTEFQVWNPCWLYRDRIGLSVTVLSVSVWNAPL